jgi:polysaccharide deacetylase family protein (PEP-CTERM system associated)
MEAVLGLLAELGIKATFFLLGMTVKNYPAIARSIAAEGHEIACHGNAHARVYAQGPTDFRRDVNVAVALIEEITGRNPVGYRAPAFSINRATLWAYDTLAELGFRYDSSQYDSPRIPNRIRPVPGSPYVLGLPSGRSLWEFPIAARRIAGRSFPVGGGSYWRLLPRTALVRTISALAAECPYAMLYLHPYECDPQPLRAELPHSPSVRQRALALQRALWRNPGNQRIPELLRGVAGDFRLVTCGQALGELERNGARRKSLSQEGVLV